MRDVFCQPELDCENPISTFFFPQKRQEKKKRKVNCRRVNFSALLVNYTTLIHFVMEL